MKNTKAILWSILEKYDGYSDYTSLCNSISNFIQDKYTSEDLIIIYVNLNKIDKSDMIAINSTIGSEIDTCLFSI
jgi:hypothetical protein